VCGAKSFFEGEFTLVARAQIAALGKWLSALETAMIWRHRRAGDFGWAAQATGEVE